LLLGRNEEIKLQFIFCFITSKCLLQFALIEIFFLFFNVVVSVTVVAAAAAAAAAVVVVVVVVTKLAFTFAV
jgi:hypothetical protein